MIPERTLVNIGMRAMRAGVPNEMTLENLPPIPSQCPACGRRLRFGTKDRRCTPGLDRIIPRLGYVPGNVRWLCTSCNSRKSNRIVSDAELKRRADLVEYPV